MSTARKVVLLDGDPIGLFGGGGGAKPEEIGIKYDEENDVIQLYYDGQWRDWKTGGMAYPVGTEVEFIFKGIVEEFVIPATGNWKVECWGAQGGAGYRNYNGGSATYAGGKGGYAVGTKRFEVDETLYICVGGAGTSSGGAGYNGGGTGANCGGGGGATHVAVTTKDLLKNTQSQNVLIVGAGGGGAGGVDNWLSVTPTPGNGGGYTGGSGNSMSWSNYKGSFTANGGGGGTQSTAGSGGSGSYGSGGSGGYGYGGSASGRGGAGGAGFYGGGAGGKGSDNADAAGGGGGSSYIKTTLSDTNTLAGQREGNGYAKFTYMGR